MIRNLQEASQRHITDMLRSIRKYDKKADKQLSTRQEHFSRFPRKYVRTNKRKKLATKAPMSPLEKKTA